LKKYWVIFIVLLVISLNAGCTEGNNEALEVAKAKQPEVNIEDEAASIVEDIVLTPEEGKEAATLEETEVEEEEVLPRYVLRLLFLFYNLTWMLCQERSHEPKLGN